MIPILAWRNIWRNPTRSAVVIIAIAMGIWAAMFMTGFATGMARSYINEAIQNIISHLQIHHPEYRKDYDAQFMLRQQDAIARLRSLPSVKGVAIRSAVNGMIGSSKSNRGVMIKGIDPQDEALVTQLDQKVIDGSYFIDDKDNQILVSRKTAEKLKVKVRSKVVLTFQDLNRDITAGAFRIIGIFDTGNSPFDEAHVFVKRKDLNRLLLPSISGHADSAALDPTQIAHEAAIFLNDPDILPSLQQQLKTDLPGMEVRNYREIAPDVQLYESMISSLSMIYLTIIMLALIFGIINTMLMAVLERIKELGMLMAIGMNKVRVFFMIVFETVFLSLIGAPLGLGLGLLTVTYINRNGLNLSAFSDSLKMYGISDHIYFEIEPAVYGQIVAAVAITATLAAVYPAYKAIRLKPVEAIRKI